jgi:flavodoxin I
MSNSNNPVKKIRDSFNHKMKILTTYFTQTGNTERIAKAIHAEASAQNDSVIKKLNATQYPSLNGYTLIFIGSPCHAGTLAAPARDFLSQLSDNPPFHLAGFITHASPAYSKTDFENCISYLASICKKKKIPYHGCFECQGSLAPELHEFIKKSKKIPDDEWDRLMASNTGHPDEEDEMRARSFARMVLSDSLK